ncbi:MAG: PAS domain S-box protein [bacterium]
MSASSFEIWWAFIVGTIVLLTLGIGFIVTIVLSQRTFIATQKEKMEALQKSKQKYTDLFNNVSDMVYIHSLDGKIQQINAAVTHHLGYQVEELIGKRLRDIIVPKYHSRIDAYLKDIQMHRASHGLMYLLSKDGNECVFEYRNSVIVQNGQSVAVRGIGRNVTEQKKAEKALRESEDRFRRLVKYSPVPIAVHSGGKWVYVNNAGLKLVAAKDPKEVIGKPVFYFIDPAIRKTVKERVRKVLKERKEATVVEEQIVCLDGQTKDVEISAIPIVYGGKQAGQVVIRDVTEHKRLQEELARAQRLETAGRVAGQIAHDFNNLLAPLTAYPTLIREDLATDHPVLELVAEMESAASQIAEINQQLLALGRRGHYTMELIDLNALMQRVLGYQAFPKEIVLKQELASDLFLIKGGTAQLTRVLANLINNAKEAMQGIGVLTIKTQNIYLDNPLIGYQTVARGEYVKLDITDTGTGIEPEILDKIFDPFFTTKKMDRMQGSGLGLSVVHGIIEDHNGYISLESTVGQGTTVSLYFPISREIKSEIAETSTKIKGGHERILVVDDDPVQRRVAEQLLKHLGYEVHTVSSGEQAVTYVRQHPQDLLVLDMVMDGIDGTETYRQVLEIQPDQRAVILSGYAMSNRVQQALRLGAGAFVAKPVTLNVLANVIRKELDRNRV